MFVEDVLEVVSDTVIVHEAAASRIQRLTKVILSLCAHWHYFHSFNVGLNRLLLMWN